MILVNMKSNLHPLNNLHSLLTTENNIILLKYNILFKKTVVIYLKQWCQTILTLTFNHSKRIIMGIVVIKYRCNCHQKIKILYN